MASIHNLIDKIDNPELREQIAAEVAKLEKQKKFGLVFEEHLPECTALYDIPVKKGAKVALKSGKVSDCYTVLKIEDGKALCLNLDKNETTEFKVDDLVCVAEFGDPIYPYLEPLDTVCNAPDSDLWHTLIEADNYHALQLLEYLYAGKVDCIYIDPPYNTRAKDWKYNNDYVDPNDSYRHSKWLAMMKKRLILAKRLLNPFCSVLIVTIDEKEYLHLECLLEEMFPDSGIQMVSSVINPSGVARGSDFGRTDEYIFFVKIGKAKPALLQLSDEWKTSSTKSSVKPTWRTVRRRGAGDLRKDSPNLFYPIVIDDETGRIIKAGESLPLNVERSSVCCDCKGASLIWPMKPNNVEGRWQLSQKELMERLQNGYVRVVAKNEYGWVPTYLAKGEIQKVKNGTYEILGRGGANNELHLSGEEGDQRFIPGSQWRIKAHNARECGSVYLNNIIGTDKFDFPKSLYAEHDAIRFFVANNPNALIVDFFAGSGTTLHAVNLLNAEDDGHRRCILVTNNEVSDSEAKEMRARGLNPGDDEWEKLGIARYVTWPRTVCSIEGHDVNGNPLKGNYIGSDIPMADGFKANAAFFKLGFLDKTKVSLGRQFKEMLPTLWMKAGAHGPCPSVEEGVPSMLILPENKMAILNDENCFGEFVGRLADYSGIDVVYLVTDYEAGYASMSAALPGKKTYQLYRDYLDNFRINAGRNVR
ncbi:MAG: site-specific DNA-methyltransferase [Clostridia bacterium]|nr:site-specific DNA-methyltransferase [Clostridia bacterium]